jgi:protein-disulfide isomerase
MTPSARSKKEAMQRSHRASRLPMLAILLILAGGSSLHAAGNSAPRRVRAKTSLPAPVKSYGSSSAPITMTVFTDYQCPACRALYDNTLRPMISDYVAAGKVYLVHHDFPIPAHKYGYQAARWEEAAARVGEFANAESALYDNQDAWASTGEIAKYLSAAMPHSDFKRVEGLMQGCSFLDAKGNCRFDSSIEADRSLGLKVPVNYTPTYIISYKGRTVLTNTGAVPWPALKQLFDSLLVH